LQRNMIQPSAVLQKEKIKTNTNKQKKNTKFNSFKFNGPRNEKKKNPLTTKTIEK